MMTGTAGYEEIDIHDLDLNAEEEQKLVKFLCDELQKAEDDSHDRHKRWKVWERQWRGRLKPEDEGPLGTLLDMPTTSEHGMQVAARILHPLFSRGDNVMVAKPRKAGQGEAIRRYNRVLDYIVDKTEAQDFAYEWFEQAAVYGTGWAKVCWVVEERKVKDWATEERSYEEEDEDGNVTVGFREERVAKERPVTVFVGARPEVISAWDMILPAGCKDHESARWNAHRFYLDRYQMEQRVDAGIYDLGEDEELGDPTSQLPKHLDAYDRVVEQSYGESEGPKAVYELYEFYIDYKGKECIVTLDKESKKILRAIENYYFDYPRPFIPFSFRPILGSVWGQSLCHMLEPMHRAYSAGLNIELSSAALASELLLFFREGSDLEKYFKHGKRVKLGAYPTLGNPKKDVHKIDLTTGGAGRLVNLMGLIEQHIGRVAHLGPGNFGIEQSGRPTATGQLQILKEGQFPLFLLLERFRRAFGKVWLQALARYRQFYPDGLDTYREAVEEDVSQYPEGTVEMGEMMGDKVEWPDLLPDEVSVETRVNAETYNADLRKQEIQSLLELVPQIYQVMAEMAQGASQPGPTQFVMVELLQGLQAVFSEFLSEMNIENAEEVNPDLESALQVGQMVMQQIQQLQQQLQQRDQQLQQLQLQQSQLQAQLVPQAAPGIPGAGNPGISTGAPPMGGAAEMVPQTAGAEGFADVGPESL